MRGKLVVIEGIDGAGGETQSNLVLEYLKSKNTQAEKMSFPDYQSPTGKFIDEYLHGSYNLSDEVLLLLHTADRVAARDRIESLLEKGIHVILDRWFNSALAFQTINFDLEKAVKLGELFGLQKPDFVFYLRISPEASMSRKSKEKEGDHNLDRNEKDLEFLRKVSMQYDKLAEQNVFGKWFVIDGEKSIEEVSMEIINRLGL